MVPDVAVREICDAAAKILFLTAEGFCDYMCSLSMERNGGVWGGDMCGDDTAKRQTTREQTSFGEEIPHNCLDSI